MDQFLIDYLKSGKAWIFVGSGLSTAMGYPSWPRLAEAAAEAVRKEGGSQPTKLLRKNMENGDYPGVFGEAKAILGGPRLLQVLRSHLVLTNGNKAYELVASWPVRVYMTTNYDDEISAHLATLGEAYRTYSNSEDHMALLTPDLDGAIVKLHGDLRSEEGLILTTEQYRSIRKDEAWEYWRVKMTSVFQMLPVIIIGHSITDPDIKHVREAAKRGAGVTQPICWIAPDVPFDVRREYLEKYRIRVISYSNESGDHHNLLRLIEHISEFIPPRLAVHLKQQIEDIPISALGDSAAAPGFYVYNRLLLSPDIEESRVNVLLAVIESAIPYLKNLTKFTVQEALESAGWPEDIKLGDELATEITKRAIASSMLEEVAPAEYKLLEFQEQKGSEKRREFEHSKERFKNAVLLRIKKKYPTIPDDEAEGISSDIEASLITYFREGG